MAVIDVKQNKKLARANSDTALNESQLYSLHCVSLIRNKFRKAGIMTEFTQSGDWMYMGGPGNDGNGSGPHYEELSSTEEDSDGNNGGEERQPPVQETHPSCNQQKGRIEVEEEEVIEVVEKEVNDDDEVFSDRKVEFVSESKREKSKSEKEEENGYFAVINAYKEKGESEHAEKTNKFSLLLTDTEL